MAAVDKVQLKQLYTEQRLSDRQIAAMFNVDRTHIVHLRKNYGIPTNNKRTYILNSVEEILISKGFQVKNLTETNGLTDVDFILNDGQTRIEIFTNTTKDKVFRFNLTNKPESGLLENHTRIRLASGRFKKLFYKTCDYMIFCGRRENQIHYWIFPSDELDININTLNLHEESHCKYHEYYEAWHLIK